MILCELRRVQSRARSLGRMSTARDLAGGSSGEGRGKFGEICHDQIRLMRRFPEGSLASINEGSAHAVRLGPDAVEGVVGNKEDR